MEVINSFLEYFFQETQRKREYRLNFEHIIQGVFHNHSSRIGAKLTKRIVLPQRNLTQKSVKNLVCLGSPKLGIYKVRTGRGNLTLTSVKSFA